VAPVDDHEERLSLLHDIGREPTALRLQTLLSAPGREVLTMASVVCSLPA
jgi:hypothetical protein